MKSHEIFAESSAELVNSMLSYLYEKERAVYRALIQNMASQRKLRPVFIERKPWEERHVWLHQALARKQSDELAAQVLQIWLLGAEQTLVCGFLDALGISHDGHGIVEDLPRDPGAVPVKDAVEKILADHDPSVVSIYLHAFQSMDDANWPSLAELLTTDRRLKFESGKDNPPQHESQPTEADTLRPDPLK